MSNPLSKATTVTISDKSYDLVMTHGTYIAVEKITGISTLTDDDQYFEKPSRNTLSALFYCLLKEAGAPYSLKDVQAMVTGKNLKSIYQTALTCHALAQAEADDSAPLVVTGSDL